MRRIVLFLLFSIVAFFNCLASSAQNSSPKNLPRYFYKNAKTYYDAKNTKKNTDLQITPFYTLGYALIKLQITIDSLQMLKQNNLLNLKQDGDAIALLYALKYIYSINDQDANEIFNLIYKDIGKLNNYVNLYDLKQNFEGEQVKTLEFNRIVNLDALESLLINLEPNSLNKITRQENPQNQLPQKSTQKQQSIDGMRFVFYSMSMHEAGMIKDALQKLKIKYHFAGYIDGDYFNFIGKTSFKLAKQSTESKLQDLVSAFTFGPINYKLQSQIFTTNTINLSNGLSLQKFVNASDAGQGGKLNYNYSGGFANIDSVRPCVFFIKDARSISQINELLQKSGYQFTLETKAGINHIVYN